MSHDHESMTTCVLTSLCLRMCKYFQPWFPHQNQMTECFRHFWQSWHKLLHQSGCAWEVCVQRWSLARGDISNQWPPCMNRQYTVFLSACNNKQSSEYKPPYINRQYSMFPTTCNNKHSSEYKPPYMNRQYTVCPSACNNKQSSGYNW